MNDDRFERDLRSLLSRDAPARVPAGFREQVIGTPLRRRRVPRLAPRRLFVSGLVAASVIAAAVFLGVGIRQFGPAATQPTPSGGKPTPTTSATKTPVILPVNATLEPTDCGWPATTALAFAGYATIGDLGAAAIIQGSPNEHVYALVTLDPVELGPIDAPMLERGSCVFRQDGLQTETAIGAVGWDWTFNGVQQNPVVTCEGTATSCVRETLAVLDAVASVGRPATRITFRADEMCIGAPFGGRPCAAPAWPRGTLRMTSAVVTFSGTEQQAFLSVLWFAGGSISAGMVALEAPPPGSTPYP
jgi:hypothetical protein